MDGLRSGIANQIQDFIDQKRASGYPYDTSERILHRFDKMTADEFPGLATITQESVERWLGLCPGEHPNTLGRRVPPIRQLGTYLNAVGIAAYVIPGHIPHRQIKYEAHIYTKEELLAFFSAIDSVPFNPCAPTRSFVIPVIFRYLYCCGLRSSEARLLSIDDVDLATGKLTVRESKGWRARVVYMSDDLLGISREYGGVMEEIIPGRNPFFPNGNGDYYSRGTLDIWFHEFWDACCCNNGDSSRARVHDFRHSYSVHRLNRWIEAGEDVNALYPLLSEYLGHANYSDTDYYLKLSESFYPEMQKRMLEVNESILPEVVPHEGC